MSHDPDLMNKYKKLRAHVQKVVRDVYWKHVSNMFSLSDSEQDPNNPSHTEKA